MLCIKYTGSSHSVSADMIRIFDFNATGGGLGGEQKLHDGESAVQLLPTQAPQTMSQPPSIPPTGWAAPPTGSNPASFSLSSPSILGCLVLLQSLTQAHQGHHHQEPGSLTHRLGLEEVTPKLGLVGQRAASQ